MTLAVTRIVNSCVLLEAARILGARTLVPIHDAQPPLYGLLRRAGDARDLERLAAAAPDAPRVFTLPTGRRLELA